MNSQTGKPERLLQELETLYRETPATVEPGFFGETVTALTGTGARGKHFLESARIFGTPQYILDRDELKERASFFIRTMRRRLPGSEFFYAFKCNDLPALVNTVKEAGFHADVAGIFELRLALKLGFEHIVFSSPGKSIDELKCALRNKKRVTVNIDNMDELLRLEELVGRGPKRDKLTVGFRLNSEPGGGGKGRWSKFGFQLHELKGAVQRVRRVPGLDWGGLHFHCSWNKTPRKYLENIEIVGRYLVDNFSPDELRRLRFFDIGGGFYPENQATIAKGEDKGLLLDILGSRRGDGEGVYEEAGFDPHAFGVTPVEPLENFARDIASAAERHILSFNPGTAVYFEPGRFIVTHSTSILLGVTAVKKNCIILDGGINMLGDYKFSEYSFAPVINLSRPSTRLRRRILYGPLCDPGDLWGYSYYGDEARKGDILAVLYQGAYTFSTAWRFIKPVPPYILLSGGRLSVAKEAETFSQRYAGCRF